MNKKLKIFVILTLVSILISCGIKNQSKAHYNLQEGEQIKDTYYYEVEKGFKEITLKIDLELEKGEVEFRLVDPNGKIQWIETIDSTKKFNQTKELEKIIGKWDLIFDSINQSAEGRLSLEFNRK